MPGPCQCPRLLPLVLRLSQGLCPLWPGMCSQHFLSAFTLLHLASVFNLGALFWKGLGSQVSWVEIPLLTGCLTWTSYLPSLCP